MVFQHLLLEIKDYLNKMPEVLAKIIKVFEIIIEMLKTLKVKLTKQKVTNDFSEIKNKKYKIFLKFLEKNLHFLTENYFLFLFIMMAKEKISN